MQKERRIRRSEQTTVALGYYLESLAGRQSWDAVALADDDGLLLGGAGGSIDAEGIAAVAPVAARGMAHPPEGFLGLVTRGRPLQVWGLALDGQPFHLAAVGGTHSSPPGEMWGTLGRILGTSCAARP